MNKLNYLGHILLTTKYKILINIFFIVTFYFLLYGKTFIFCMNDNPNTFEIPSVAEAKDVYRPTQQMLAIKREIMTYAGSHAHYLERINELEQTVAEQKTQIEELTTAIEGKKLQKTTGYNGLNYSRSYIYSRCGGYKNEINLLEEKISYLERHVNQLNSDLIKSQAVVDEYRQHIYRR